jgi:hypothetical protein
MPLIVETMFSFKGLKQPWKDRFFSVIQPEIPGIGAHGPAFLPKAGCQRSNSTSLGSRFSLEAKMISGLTFSTSAARCSTGNEVTNGLGTALAEQVPRIRANLI